MRPIVAPLIPLLVAIAFPSCVSRKFERAWEEAAHPGLEKPAGFREQTGALPARGNAESQNMLPTRWEGTWHSDKHKNGGKLRAVVRQPYNERAEIFFEAGWHGFTTAYPVNLSARRQGNGVEISGQHNLRSWVGGGIYNYKGLIKPDQFSAAYDSDYDIGTFNLVPVPAP